MSEQNHPNCVPGIPTKEQENTYINDLHAGRMPKVDSLLMTEGSIIPGIKELRNSTGMTLVTCKDECTLRLATLQHERPAQKELEFWKALAIHLADCHAATAQYDGMLSSCSKSRRERFAAICDDAATAIAHQYYRPRHERSAADVAQRCAEAAKDLRDKLSGQES